MFEEDLLDEEIKKKKRRILVLLFVILLLGTMAALPISELSITTSPPESGAVVEAPGHTATATRPTLAPASTSTSASTPRVEATTTSPPQATPQWTATTTVTHKTPTVTKETPGGAGGGTQAPSPTATGTPTDTPPALATPTAKEPGVLPASGADTSQRLDWLAVGLVATSLAMLVLGVGCAQRNTRLRQQ
jgi:hypothetical protein